MSLSSANATSLAGERTPRNSPHRDRLSPRSHEPGAGCQPDRSARNVSCRYKGLAIRRAILKGSGAQTDARTDGHRSWVG